VAAHGGSEGVHRDAEMGDLGGETSHGVCFLAAGAMFFDNSAKVGVAVKGGSAESGACSDVIEGDVLSFENYCGAGIFDGLSALFGGHPVCV
jgi:hypothetical protein